MRTFKSIVAVSIMALIFLLGFFQQATFAKEAVLQWYKFDEGTTVAKDVKKPMMIYFFAPWCGYCNKMENEVFTDSAAQTLMQKFVLIRVRIDSDDVVIVSGKKMTESKLARNFGVSGTPAFIFQEFDGQEISQIPGYIKLDKFTGILEFISEGAYKKMPFSDYMKRWEQGK